MSARRALIALGVLWAAVFSAAPLAAATDEAERVLVLLRLPPPHFQGAVSYAGAYGGDAARAARRRTALAVARPHGLRIVDEWPMPLAGVDCFVMVVPAEKTGAEISALLSRDRRVEWVQPVGLYEASAANSRAGDPLSPAQPAVTEWQLPRLHVRADGRGVKLAIIDSQIDLAHPDLSGQIALTANFVDELPAASETHGTAVAGIIAARPHNGVGIAGIAPAARVMGLRACWAKGARTLCDSFSLAKAIYYALEKRARIINLSLAGPPDRLLEQLLDLALSRGTTVVAAYNARLPRGGFPARHAGVVAVDDRPPASTPPGVYSAPGRGVPTTRSGGKWSVVDGSSYSAAHVSGLFALLLDERFGKRAIPELVSSEMNGGTIDACATVLRPLGGTCRTVTSAKLAR